MKYIKTMPWSNASMSPSHTPGFGPHASWIKQPTDQYKGSPYQPIKTLKPLTRIASQPHKQENPLTLSFRALNLWTTNGQPLTTNSLLLVFLTRLEKSLTIEHRFSMKRLFDHKDFASGCTAALYRIKPWTSCYCGKGTFQWLRVLLNPNHTICFKK